MEAVKRLRRAGQQVAMFSACILLAGAIEGVIRTALRLMEKTP